MRDKYNTINMIDYWMFNTQLDKFIAIPNTCFHAVSGMPSNIVFTGRPYGGCAIVWKTNFMVELKQYSLYLVESVVLSLKYTYSKSPAVIGLQKKSRDACFHVRYRPCSSAANVSALLFKVDFPLSNS